MKIGTLETRNTRDLIGPSTRFCAMVSAPAKFGKTKLAASLNEITTKYRNKPCLFIAFEAAEGGGTMSVADMGIDYVMPSNFDEVESVLAGLATNDYYGGIIFDNATDYVLRTVKPHAMKFPTKEKLLGARIAGVPVRGDYQTMGEVARGQLNKLVNLTNETTPEKFRKDLIVTALEKEVQDDDGNVTGIVPNLPGALAGVATAMFQSVIGIRIKPEVIPDPNGKAGSTKRLSVRRLHVKADGVRVTDDRSGIWQHDYRLTDNDGQPIGLLPMYEEWLERFKVKV